MTATVNVTELTKHFGQKQALKGISFEAQPGEIFGLLGPNGAGKTTTLRIISTLISADAGTVTVAGFDTATQPKDVRRRIGMVTAEIGAYPRLSTKENIEFFARLSGMNGDSLPQRMEQVSQRLEMAEFMNRRAESLSSGQKQKLAIARAIIHDPEVLIFDEPTSNLDVLASKSVREFMVEAKQSGRCVIFSTHVLHDAERLCDRVTIVHEGLIVASGTPKEVRGDEPGLEEAFLKLVGAA